ncbi:SDR family oxidoreductase [Tropicibacter sp. Alg240-R139]|uniref:SDR family NAD(P)-dependent oxidoreductase n=1 Tax=Tropicibacter sp. Alg240-R139 TaxID=2305991 RepID=UPI0013DFDEFC|nr:SDR family NAD(P)-dependent oxidoreductase [Tropicibacter sp. Alg240-R139]
MTAFLGKTYWLAGASEGLGRELAKGLSDAGARLILSARNTERLDALCELLPDARALPMDVSDAVSVHKAAASVGPIDGLIYNAGVYDPVESTSWSTRSALTMVDVNFNGALRVVGEVLPGFLERGSGDITLIGSLAGYRGLPAAVGYGASKSALISLAETMRHDLKGSGIVVRLVNPGFIKTRLTSKNEFKMPMIMEPEDAAARTIKAMQSRRFRTDFPAPFSWALKLYGVLPDWVVYRGA